MKALICPALGPAETLKVMDVEQPLGRSRARSWSTSSMRR